MMVLSNIRVLYLLFPLTLAFASCASTSLTAVDRSGNLVMGEDEKRLWNRSREEQERLDRSGNLYGDSVLTQYVNSVASEMWPTSANSTLYFRVKIIRNPLLNAFAYPNGVIYMHTGILSKMDNEAQLATVIGHEMSHAIHRHAMKSIHNFHNTAGFLSVLQIATLPFGVFGGLVGLLGNVGGLAAVTGYSRELETQADASGLAMMAEAGYDLQEAPRIFAHMKHDLEEQKIDEPFFFGSHPKLQDRIESYNTLITKTYANALGRRGTERFDTLFVNLLLDNASLDLSMGRSASAERAARRVLQTTPRNASAYYCIAEAYRQRADSTARDSSEMCYSLAIANDSAFAPPYKALGMIYYKRGEKQAAVEAFSHYLELRPQAEDRKYIERYLEELNKR